ncbi:MAG: cyclase family protein [Clostridia bacterium]|nr:cyclase family protein [Clostridia bacterium]
MKLYDISQEVFSCAVYPGDPSPSKKTLASMESGALYNLTAFSMCAHNGTHIDAPFHFINDGKTVESLELSRLIGAAYVYEHNGIVTEEDIKRLLEKIKTVDAEAAKRILIKGKAELSLEAAKVLACEKIYLYGNESQTVGPENAPMAVHKVLLGAEVVLLEGVRLSDVPEGIYLLFAAPLSLAGADGAPCRAVLAEMKQ